MATPSNTVIASDIDRALDAEMAHSFDQDYNRLAEILGIFSPEVVAAGTALYQYKVTGSLSSTSVAEGDLVPLSNYKVKRIAVGSVDPKPYRKVTSAKAILQGGYENAVMRTDMKMVNDVRKGILADFFGYLANGAASAEGDTLQMLLAQSEAVLADAAETAGETYSAVAHFVNPFDVAGYLGKANVTTQTVFGMQYLNGFLGVEHMFVTNQVGQGKTVATPVENIHVYGVDFGALADGELAYTPSDGSLIGVAHEGAYDRASAATNVLAGATFLAENTGLIVKGELESADDESVDGESH